MYNFYIAIAGSNDMCNELHVSRKVFVATTEYYNNLFIRWIYTPSINDLNKSRDLEFELIQSFVKVFMRGVYRTFKGEL